MNYSDYLFADNLIEMIVDLITKTASAIANCFARIMNKSNNWRKYHGLPMRRRKWLR